MLPWSSWKGQFDDNPPKKLKNTPTRNVQNKCTEKSEYSSGSKNALTMLD